MLFQDLCIVVNQNNFVVLDTETTGLSSGSQICQIAVIDQDGNVLIDTLVRPTIPIPSDATAIHGITDDRVVDAPEFPEVAEQLAKLIIGKDIIIYNADYDLARITDSLCVHEIREEILDFWYHRSVQVVCAMQVYAEYWGDWNSYRRSFKWQSLTNACRQQSLPTINAHNALGDCRMTLALVKKICANPDDAMPEGDWLSEK